jgi:hypothetical protein
MGSSHSSALSPGLTAVIVTAVIGVERLVGRVPGDHRDQADREDRRGRGLHQRKGTP